MKVLIISGSIPPLKCGVGDYSYNLAIRLASKPNMSVGILTSKSASGVAPVHGVEVFSIMAGWARADFLKAAKLVLKWKPDVVHIQYPTQGYGHSILPHLFPIIFFLMGVKVVQTWHEIYSCRDFLRFSLKAIVPGGLVVVRPSFKDFLHPMLRWGLSNKVFSYIKNASATPVVNLSKEYSEKIKNEYLDKQKRLIVFFGFIYPHKGVEQIFDIANSESDQIVIAGESGVDDQYYKSILEKASSSPWVGKVRITGFLPSRAISELLSVADAVVLPFRVGGGEWNTSIHSAVAQKTLVITTSPVGGGYDERLNIYYAKIDDVIEMQAALEKYSGIKRKLQDDIDTDGWLRIVDEHQSLYSAVVGHD